jgi:nuclear transport factor 2 (NTF2) superfamily protein
MRAKSSVVSEFVVGNQPISENLIRKTNRVTKYACVKALWKFKVNSPASVGGVANQSKLVSDWRKIAVYNEPQWGQNFIAIK